MAEQRWLTLDMIATTLRVPKSYIRELTKQGFLVSIGPASKRRWLDPTPEYAEKLYLAGVLHRKTGFVATDISLLGLLSIREVAVICGWSVDYARLYMQRHKDVPRLRINASMYLWSVSTVREILWRRQKNLSKQKSPFLIQKMIDFFWRQKAEDERDIPSEEDHLADAAMQRKLEVLARRFDKADAQNDFASKVALAGKIVQILDWAKLAQSPSTTPSQNLPH